MPKRLTHEEATLVIQRVFYDPLEPYPGSGKKPWRVRCRKCGEERLIKYDNAQQGYGCRHCSGSEKLTDEIAVPIMRAANLEPLTPYPGGGNPWKCRCTKCGSEVTPSLESIKRGQTGCIYCAHRVIRPEDALRAMNEAGFDPLTPYSGHSRQPWESRCRTCGRLSTPSLNSVQARHSHCKYCAGVAVVAEEAVRVMADYRLAPLEPYPGATTPW